MAEYKFPSDDAARDDDDGGGDNDNDYERAIDAFFDGADQLVDVATRHADDAGRRLLKSTAGVLDHIADSFRRAADGDVSAKAAADDGVSDG